MKPKKAKGILSEFEKRMNKRKLENKGARQVWREHV